MADDDALNSERASGIVIDQQEIIPPSSLVPGRRGIKNARAQGP